MRKKRIRKHAPRIGRTAVITLVIGLAVTGAVKLVFASPAFFLREKTVTGNRLTPDTLVYSHALGEVLRRDPWRKWLNPWHAFFWLGVKELSIESRVPAVLRVKITTSLANRRLRLVTEERNAAGVWCGTSGGCFAFDERGVLWSRAPHVEGPLVVKVEDTRPSRGRLLTRIYKDSSVVGRILSALDEVKTAGLYPTRVVIREEQIGAWDMLIAPGVVFRFDTGFIPEKLNRIVEELKPRIAIGAMSFLDFSVPNKIYYK